MLERDIEKPVCKFAKKNGVMPIKFRDPGRAGAPDRMFFVPGEKVFFIEFKRPGEKPKKHQLAYHAELKKLGFTVYVVDSVEYGKECVENHI